MPALRQYKMVVTFHRSEQVYSILLIGEIVKAFGKRSGFILTGR